MLPIVCDVLIITDQVYINEFHHGNCNIISFRIMCQVTICLVYRRVTISHISFIVIGFIIIPFGVDERILESRLYHSPIYHSNQTSLTPG